MKKWLERFYYAFPTQLVLLHFRANLLFLVLWLFLYGVLFGFFGVEMGLRYFILDPEYLGAVSFWSFFIIGVTLGMFYIAWNTTTYILNSYRFPFLASLNRPFYKFSINNFVIPGLFILFYLISVIRFQWYNEFASHYNIIFYCTGLLVGFSTMLFMTIIYFRFTNRDIVSIDNRRKLKLAAPLKALILKKQERELAIARHNPYKDAIRVDYFFTETLRPRLVRSVRHYNFKLLERIFRQNHANALVIQSLSITALILMGALVEYPYFRIPTAASVLILLSIITTVLGALTYWLRQWRSFVLVVALLFLNQLMKTGILNYENRAYGLNYEQKAEYSYKVLDSLSAKETYIQDLGHSQRILENWRSKFNQSRLLRKPRMVVIAVSGGGQRASLWTTYVLQEIDRVLGGEGKLMKHTTLMTGASGGMWGAAYFRELYHQKIKGEEIDLQDSTHLVNISKDLSNSVAFTFLVNDLFIPWVTREVNGYSYKQDRGYIWEQQYIENTGGIMGMDLEYYREPEASGQIPMMFVTPTIINDGRFLVISPQPVSYMAKPPFVLQSKNDFAEIDGVDFGKLLSEQDPYNMRFATALRMNATFPLIFPSVHLPTQPTLEIMDAGFRDNFGLESAIRFLALYRNWIRNNTSGVTIISIRGSKKINDIPLSNQPGLGSTFFSPLGAIFDINNIQDYHHDSFVGFLKSKIGYDKVDLVRFIYKPTTLEQKASLSLHLTQREKNDILSAINIPSNQAALNRLKETIK
jgi:hypothetical protein